MQLFDQDTDDNWVMTSVRPPGVTTPDWVRILDGPLPLADAHRIRNRLRATNPADLEHGEEFWVDTMSRLKELYNGTVIQPGASTEKVREIRCRLAGRPFATRSTAPSEGEVWDSLGPVASLRGDAVLSTNGREIARISTLSQEDCVVRAWMPSGESIRRMAEVHVSDQDGRPEVVAVMHTEGPGPIGYLTDDGLVHKYLPGQGEGYGEQGYVGRVRPHATGLPAAKLLGAACNLVSRGSFPLA